MMCEGRWLHFMDWVFSRYFLGPVSAAMPWRQRTGKSGGHHVLPFGHNMLRS